MADPISRTSHFRFVLGTLPRGRSGALGTVVLFSAGDAEAGVVFDGGNIETCEKVLTRDLEATDIGFRTDPDTPAQPIVAQLLSLLDALLQSNNVSHALKAAGAESPDFNAAAMVWSRLLSQTLMAVLQLSAHCSDAVMAACQQGNGLANVLPALLRVAIRPVQVPALITAQVKYQGRPTPRVCAQHTSLVLSKMTMVTIVPINVPRQPRSNRPGTCA